MLLRLCTKTRRENPYRKRNEQILHTQAFVRAAHRQLEKAQASSPSTRNPTWEQGKRGG